MPRKLGFGLMAVISALLAVLPLGGSGIESALLGQTANKQKTAAWANKGPDCSGPDGWSERDSENWTSG